MRDAANKLNASDLFHEFSDPLEARVGKAAPNAVLRCSAVAGPIDEHRAADDQVTRNKAPITAVLAVVAAVPHDKKAVRRNRHGFALNAEFVVADRQITPGEYGFHLSTTVINVPFFVGLSFLKLARDQCGLIVVRVGRIADKTMLRQGLAVYEHLIVLELDRLARKADHSLNIIDLIRNYWRISP